MGMSIVMDTEKAYGRARITSKIDEAMSQCRISPELSILWRI